MPESLFSKDAESTLGAAVSTKEQVFEGIGVAPGIAIGKAYRYAGGAYQVDPEQIDAIDIDSELERFEQAVVRSEYELRKIATVAKEKLDGSPVQLFDAQLLMLRDPAFYEAVTSLIQDDLLGSGYAVQTVLRRHGRRLETSGSARIRERVADIQDVQNRVLRNLQEGKALSKIEENRIVVAQNLTAADVLLFSRRNVLGCILDFGGPTSHVSIMARALNVPTVVSLHELTEQVHPGDMLILDGLSGKVILNPEEATLERYKRRQGRLRALNARKEELAEQPAQTRDGHRVSLQANIEFREELPLLQEYGAEGIGLFRTEMLFLTEGRALDEEQQVEIYTDALRAAAPNGVTFRLLDLGGDKLLPINMREANPFLGWRGVRILLDKPELLRIQLRAIFRASVHGKASILLPMVTSIDEVRSIRSAVEEVERELKSEAISHISNLPFGIMVEVPSTALEADSFAREVDFFSLGTNDLTQYTLAVDRGNDLVADLYTELHPAVLYLINKTVKSAKDHNLPVSLCGEMAADPRLLPLLIGMGIQRLSVSPAYLTIAKVVLSEMTLSSAQELAVDALNQRDAKSTRELLNNWLVQNNPAIANLLGISNT